MAKKNKKKSISAKSLLQSTKKRALASKAYYSSQLEEEKRENQARGYPKYRILRYRRVVLPEDLPFPVSRNSFVTPEQLDSQLRYVSRNCNVVSLEKLVALIEEYEEIPPNTVALTFDGGHSDSMFHGLPLLMQYGLPATFFLPTAFIGSKTYLYDDGLMMMILVLLTNRLPLPKFDFLDAELQKALVPRKKSTAINEAALAEYIDTVRTLDHDTRMEIVSIYGKLVSEIRDFPQHEDFIEWDDVQQLVDLGFSIGSMGHFLVNQPSMHPSQIAEDIGTSFKVLLERKIEPIRIPASVDFLSTQYFREAVRPLPFRYILTSFPTTEPRFQTELPMELGRISISSANSYSIELFACRLWQLTLSGITF